MRQVLAPRPDPDKATAYYAGDPLALSLIGPRITDYATVQPRQSHPELEELSCGGFRLAGPLRLVAVSIPRRLAFATFSWSLSIWLEVIAVAKRRGLPENSSVRTDLDHLPASNSAWWRSSLGNSAQRRRTPRARASSRPSCRSRASCKAVNAITRVSYGRRGRHAFETEAQTKSALCLFHHRRQPHHHLRGNGRPWRAQWRP